jgi:ferredoxin/flavodoxin
MTSIIYYFSGTGNSLIVAKDIAEKINAKLIPIPSLMSKKRVIIKENKIGIVFPVYHSGLPNIIKKFVDKINDLNGKYIFGISTYGGSPGVAFKYLNKIIETKNGKLSSGFGVRMPYNYIIPSFSFKNFSFSIKLGYMNQEKQRGMFLDWSKKIDSICEQIINNKIVKFKNDSTILITLVDKLKLRDTLGKPVWLKMSGCKDNNNLTFWESIKLMDHGFKVDEKCNGCRICEKICPVNNIRFVDRKPIWLHNCEQCFACLQWCPHEAIQFGRNTKDCKRYHHPDVNINDMIF